MHTKRPLPLLCLLAAALLLIAACGDDDDDDTGGPTEETPNAIPSQAPPQEQPTPAQALDAALSEPTEDAIAVTLAGTEFSPNNLHVPLGSAVTIRLANEDAATHSMRVAGIDGAYQTEDDAVVEIIDAGGTAELTFSGAAAGSYTFRCDFHPSSMGGAIVVD
jgi:plastocyanin